LPSAFAPGWKQRDEQSNKSGLNKTISDRMLRMKNKIIVTITAITILLLIVGLYFGSLRPPDESSLGKTEYGVCIHLYQYEASTTMQLIKQINTTWVRIDWIPKQMDPFVSSMKDNDISILAILDHNTMNTTYPNENFTRLQWQNEIQNIMSTEAAKKIDAWEIWNEPNAKQFFLGYMNGNPQNYFDMLKDAHQIIKAASPNTTVLAAGLSPNETWMDWLTDFANLSPQRYFDFQGVHIYDESVEKNLNIISETKKVINKDIWITEVGHPSAPIDEDETYSPEGQVLFLENNYLKLSELKIPIFWYQLIDELEASEEKEKHFGLFDINTNSKPAVDAFIRFTK